MSLSQPAAAIARISLRNRPALFAACIGALAAAGLTGIAGPAFDLAIPARAQDAATQDAQSGKASPELIRLVDDFYHAAAVAQYPAANALGRQILEQNPSATALLSAFREVQGYRGRGATTLDQQFVRWQNVPQLSEVATQIVGVVNEGRVQLATDPQFILDQVQRLGNGGRAYTAAVAQLRNSGEYAAPMLLATLADPDQGALHGAVRRAVRDLGLPLVNPLLAATSMDNEPLLAQVILLLADLGYPVAVPYILELQETNPGQQVQQASTRALKQLGYTGGSNAATEYRAVAEQFWLKRSAVQPDSRYPMANIWSWNGQSLEAKAVPPRIFDEIMTMRAAGNTLALSAESGNAAAQNVQDEAMSLWLAANYRREAELEAGEMDATRPEGDPDASYYGTQAGVPYLLAVLDRAAGERELPAETRYDAAEVSLRTIRSLQQIIGESSLPEGDSPLTRAMNYPDRSVRIEAAMALAQALPTRPVSGSEQVVPLLADALSQTGEPTVLMLMADNDELNSLSTGMEGSGFNVAGATDANTAVEQARALPGVDVFVIDSNLGQGAVNDLLSQARGNPKLNGAAKLIIAASTESAYAAMGDADPTITTTTARDAQGLQQAIEEARTQMGGLPLDADAAGSLATRAGELLKEIGLGSSIYTLQTAQPQLLASLDDERVAIQQLAAEIVALLEGAEPQQALLRKGTNPDTAEPVKVSAFQALATSAKRHGNQLGDADLDALMEAATTAESMATRAAAAEAIGALSLPVDQARRLIIRDTATGEGTTPPQE